MTFHEDISVFVSLFSLFSLQTNSRLNRQFYPLCFGPSWSMCRIRWSSSSKRTIQEVCI